VLARKLSSQTAVIEFIGGLGPEPKGSQPSPRGLGAAQAICRSKVAGGLQIGRHPHSTQRLQILNILSDF
jgi:hypothetical protein